MTLIRPGRAASKLAMSVARLYLPAGRLFYAGASGLSLIVAAAVSPQLDVIGEYIYQIGFASAIATVSALGLDRIMARRMAAGSLLVGLPGPIIRFRLILACALVALAAILGVVFGHMLVFLVCALFVVSRMLYADLEAVWIAARLGDKALFFALVINGTVTAGGIVCGSIFSSVAMIALSSCGNIAALGFLLALNRLKWRNDKIHDLTAEAHGISWSLVLAVIYARVDLVILASVGASLESVAMYGIVTRVFDALALIRGALAQDEARSLASVRIRTRARRLLLLSTRVQLIVLATAILGLICAYVLSESDSSFAVLSDYGAFAMLFVALPLFFSHLPTTAMIYSDRRSSRLLVGSIITCAGSIALKWLLISYFDLYGAVLAIGCVELLSAIVFYFLYWANARSWRSSRIIWAPLLSAVVLFTVVILVF